MRVGVLSDTHGKIKKAKKAVEQMGHIDLLLHAGDYYEDAIILGRGSGIKVKAVTGNCDIYTPEPVEELLKIGDYRLYLTHGHLFGVKRSLTKLYQRAEELGAHIVIYGHTHMPHQEKKNGMLFLNREVLPGRDFLECTALLCWNFISQDTRSRPANFKGPGPLYCFWIN